ncbi:MAG TPA: septal ring lytic transglycosylase RlpA family protein [Actinomycetota bacterium]|nr:septal ring lytic transglycosylase RlpA family protein [Actinomycetota bacterium]
MLDLSHSRARRGGIALAVAFALAAPAAVAQEAGPYPVVDHARTRLWLGGTAVVKGHLENGAPGDEVSIEKKTGPGEWKLLESGRVDESMRFVFRLRRRMTTSILRVSWTDSTGEMTTHSKGIRVIVRPRLKVRTSPRHPFTGERIVVRGGLWPPRPGRRVHVQRRISGRWEVVARPRVRDGRFRTSFTAGAPRRGRVRVVFRGDELNAARSRTKRVKVFDPDPATWYGPGLYGNSTACGKTLTPDTIGVAHRSLPCGTMVDIFYRGRTVRVPVIDRGPYTSAQWDLTRKTAVRLNFSGYNTIGTIH